MTTYLVWATRDGGDSLAEKTDEHRLAGTITVLMKKHHTDLVLVKKLERA